MTENNYKLINMEDIEAEDVEWLWEGRKTDNASRGSGQRQNNGYAKPDRSLHHR